MLTYASPDDYFSAVGDVPDNCAALLRTASRLVRQATRAAIAAAEPHVRAKIADEIEQHYLGADFGRNPTTGADSPDASLHDAYDEALNLAARIARQEQP